jgi:lysophospholipase L1-like esterase
VLIERTNATTTGNLTAQLAETAEKLDGTVQSSNGFMDVKQYPNEMYVIGDSISEGYNASDRQNTSYVGLIRKAFMKFYNTKNYGFENFNNEQTKLTKRLGMTFAEANDVTVFGGRIFTSSTLSQYIEVLTNCKDFKIVYKKQIGGAILNVLVDGVQTATIDTSVTPAGNIDNACFSNPIVLSGFGERRIRIVNSEAKPCAVMGIVLLNEASKNEPVLQNASHSGIKLQDIPNEILDVYASSNNVIFAIGRNDFGLNDALFTSKVDYVLNKIKTNNGKAIVCDFYFGFSQNEISIKRILKERATFYGFKYLDFQNYSFGTNANNVLYGYTHSDQIHPLDKGHANIARTLLAELKIPYTPYEANSNVNDHIVLPDNTILATTDITVNTFKNNKVYVNNVNNTTGLPVSIAGTLVTFKFIYSGFSKQIFYQYESANTWVRSMLASGAWTAWVSLVDTINFKLTIQNAYNNSTLKSGFPTGFTYFDVASNHAEIASFPEAKGGTLETYNNGYAYQIYHVYLSVNVYKRYWTGTAWSAWTKINV